MKQAYARKACLILLLCSVFSQAQQTVATNTNVAVPPLVNFSGTLTDASGKPLTGSVAVTFQDIRHTGNPHSAVDAGQPENPLHQERG